ncbi:hypothetical protein [Rhodovulum viride]|uniref:hypothetical protein n=1 Tax=Rhodovulum viride TaxID=1231134 RepID=UPI001C657243|nr:hypothetical protein [Rhodovulum viride]
MTEPLPHRVLPVVGIWTRDAGRNGYLRQVERGNIIFGGAAERVAVALDPGHAQADPARLPGQVRALVRLLPALGASGTTRGLLHAFSIAPVSATPWPS